MKITSFKEEIKTKSTKDLVKLLDDQHHKLNLIRLEVVTKKQKDHTKIRKIKRQIAQVLTLVSQKTEESDEE